MGAVLEVSLLVRDLVVDIPVVAQMQISWVLFLSMSSRSSVGAKLLVKVSICALSLARILTSWVTFAWRLTFHC